MRQDHAPDSCEICGSLPDFATTIQNAPLPPARDQLRLVRAAAQSDLLACPACSTQFELRRHFVHDHVMGDFTYEELARQKKP